MVRILSNSTHLCQREDAPEDTPWKEKEWPRVRLHKGYPTLECWSRTLRGKSLSLLSCVTEAACLRQPCSSEVKRPWLSKVPCGVKQNMGWQTLKSLAASCSPLISDRIQRERKGFWEEVSVDVKRQTIPKQNEEPTTRQTLLPDIDGKPGECVAGTS